MPEYAQFMPGEVEGNMDRKILEFAALLRRAGIRVSHSEVADCLKGLSMTGLDREMFYHTLTAALVKDQADLPTFNKVFDYYFDPDFFGHRQDAAARWPELILPFLIGGHCNGDGSDENGCTGDDPVIGTDQGRSTGFGHGQGLATAAVENFMQVIKIGDSGEMSQLVKRGVASLGEIKEEDLLDMKNAIRQVKVFLEWNMGASKLEQEAGQNNEAELLKWQERLSQLEEMLYRELEKVLINRLGVDALNTILARENINELDFYSLSAPQTAEIKKKISKLAHKLATRLSFRQKRAMRGKVDLQRTIRKSMATGGVPIRPAYRDRYPTRPEIVVLCDLSGSVKIFSEFMLQLMYSIQSRFLHVRTFVFVDTPDEVTELMRNREIEEGVREIYNKAKFSKTAFSDYGGMFIDFCQKYMDALTKKTTLIIVGDARNNYQREHQDYFQQMAAEVKKVIWLNPEPVERWDREDSIMSVYALFCSQIFECRNLQQLDVVARKLI